jgi:hypothetical protein
MLRKLLGLTLGVHVPFDPVEPVILPFPGGRVESPEPPVDDVLRVSPRDIACQQARCELMLWLLEWRGKHELTAAEYLSLVAGAAAEDATLLVKVERKRGS